MLSLDREAVYHHIETSINGGNQPGSYRDIAVATSIPPDRVRTAVEWLEQQGWILTAKGSGRYAAKQYALPDFEPPPASRKSTTPPPLPGMDAAVARAEADALEAHAQQRIINRAHAAGISLMTDRNALVYAVALARQREVHVTPSRMFGSKLATMSVWDAKHIVDQMPKPLTCHCGRTYHPVAGDTECAACMEGL